MAKPKIFGPFRRLLPMRRHFGGYSSLWLAKDHVLAVSSTGYTDKYNRYYFRDIQGFMLADSERRFYIGIVLGLLGAAAVLFSLLGKAHWGFVLAELLVFGVPLIWNHVKGPGCKLYIVTQVQSTRLMAVARRASAEKLIEDLRPLIEAAQSDWQRPEAAGASFAQSGVPGGALSKDEPGASASAS